MNTGVFNASFNPAQLNTRSFNASILRLFPGGRAPLFGLTSQTKKKTAKSSQHGYFTKTFNFTTITFTGTTAGGAVNAVAGDTALEVATTVGLVPGMVFRVPGVGSTENIRIDSIAGATSIVVTRSYGRIAAGAIVLNAVLSPVGNAHGEGSQRPTARSINTVYVPNYTQIFRNAWAVTATASKSLTEAGFGNVGESRQDAALLHSTDMESALFLSQASAPAINATTGLLDHATQGVMDAIVEHAPAGNVLTTGATTNYLQFETLLTPGFAQSTDLGNPNERIGFCDATTLRVINDLALLGGTVQTMPDQTTFGLNFTRVKFFKGVINLMEHPMFNDSPAFAGTLVTLDLPALQLAYLGGRDAIREEFTNNGTKANANGVDAVGGSLTSEFAVELVNPGACQIITGWTAGARIP